jgi:hypothetical protein
MSLLLCGATLSSGTPALSVSISPANVDVSAAAGSPSGTVTSNTATAAASGGTSPYTYAWTFVSGDTFTLSAASSAATTFSRLLFAGSTAQGTYRVTATDAASATATADITVNLENSS